MPLAGQLVRASDIPVRYTTSKAGNESVTSSSTEQNDDDITIPLDVGVYIVHLWGAFTGSQAGDLKMMWTFTGTATINHRSGQAPFSTLTGTVLNTALRHQAGFGIGTEPAYGMDGANTALVHETIKITVTVAGTFQWQWAQNTPDATATVATTQTFAEWQKCEEV